MPITVPSGDDLFDIRGDPAIAAMVAFFEQQIPFNRFLGMSVVALGRGFAELVIPRADHLVGDPFRPALHGGVISTLADTCGGLAVFALVGIEKRVSTVDMRVDYLRPGRVDADVRARARVLRLGNRIGATDTIVFHDDPHRPVAKSAAVYGVRP